MLAGSQMLIGVDVSELTPAVVGSVYRALLGRDPESAEVVVSQVALHQTLESLLSAMVESREFKSRHQGAVIEVSSTLAAPDIEVTTSPELIDRLLDRTIEQWARLGEEVPYWSVLSAPDYEPESFENNAEAFWASGSWILEAIDAVQSHLGVTIGGSSCLELGAGVGRMTRFLATRFDKVQALDISPGNLAICEETTRDCPGTVSPVLLRSLEDLESLPEVDCVVSFIVLQHNPPPIQRMMLDRVLARLRPGGIALFQTPTDSVGYRFSVKEYLSSEPSSMDMHALPVHEVLACMLANRVMCLDVQRDAWAGPGWESHTFVGQKLAEESH